MEHRERVLAALSHKEPDKIPIDLGSTINSSMVVESYEKLIQHFGFNSANRLCNRMMRTVQMDEAILKTLDIDTRGVFMGGPLLGREQELGQDRYRDFWGIVRRKPEDSYYYDLVASPLAGEISISDVLNYPWPDPDDPGFTRDLKSRVRWLRENTDAAIVLQLPPAFIHPTQFLRGFEDWYCDFALHSKVMEPLFDAVLEITLRITQNALKEVGREVDVVCVAEDIGTQDRLMISHDHYRKYIKPRHGKFFRQIRDLSPGKLLYHSCGCITSIIEDLIDMGVEALNPIQVTAPGMIPSELKRKYGCHLAFWGGIDVQFLLPKGTVAEVEKKVEELIEELGSGGGYILSMTHNIQPDVPLENMLAPFQHARSYKPSYTK
jgi:uroporphyrinogen decarboxylase